jgi:MSHA biogenesis protein MshK
MADRVMTANVVALPQWAIAACCLLVSASFPVHAEDLPDPTRPPASIFAPVGVGSEARDNQSSGLHTIIISGIRRAAIIDGQTVELGGEHGGARLIEVNEGGVVLQRAQTRQVLTLFPGVKISRKDSPGIEQVETGKVSGEKGSLNPASSKEKSLNGESPVLQESSADQFGDDNTRPIVHKEGK